MAKASFCSPWILLLLLEVALLTHQVVAGQAPYACDQRNATLLQFGFCNTRLPTSTRVEDLISRMTLQEKIIQLVNNAAGIPRLGLPRYEWWQEALHGVAVSPGVKFGGKFPGATSFPMPILTAASFDAVSTEARAMHNYQRAGLTYWSPNVNIYRDPRWGRGQETPGEDPLLSSKYATFYVRGLQDTNLGGDKLKVSACCKHMTAYDVDNWKGTTRFKFNAIVTQQDLSDTYNPPFQSCVEDAKVSSVMCSYNRVNGVPTCADYNLLSATVRSSWNLNGSILLTCEVLLLYLPCSYIVSDCDSLQTFFDNTNYAKTAEDVVADALLAGLNLDCGPFLAIHTQSAITNGKITEANVNQALRYLYNVQMRLGLYDGNPRSQPYGNLGPQSVCTGENQQLALDAAKEGIVLLKNNGNVLPFSKSNIRTVAAIGPHAKATRAMIGNYQGIPCKYTTPHDGLSAYARVVYSAGCSDVACYSNSLIGSAASTASQADAVVLFVGLDLNQEAEGKDRTSLLLPGKQQELVTEVTKAAKGPVVLVIFSGGSVDVSFAKYDKKVQGMLWAGYPGEAGGAAIAQVLFGDHNPGGRLPVTWYPESFTGITMLDMNMRPDASRGYPGRTYRFYTGQSVYNFGYGKTYSKLSHKFKEAPLSLGFPEAAAVKRSCDGNLTCFHLNAHDEITCSTLTSKVRILVHNEGDRPSNRAVLLYSSPPNAGRDGAPIRQLAGFGKVSVAPGAVENVEIEIDPCKHLSHAGANGVRILHGGIHTLAVGNARHPLPILLQS
ncbi:hypothetical protein SELMODRAFT_419541 [Selaginella moellendorffii]|uniref:Fibronectin type III-like domain-containing protein n=1 Tax=Selaginella moellendorffii TaxID=88036 RepID=D8S995_SELML|nr:hypothetical protein SELMODRAFT_419541 [Selaginella moellendorffii]